MSTEAEALKIPGLPDLSGLLDALKEAKELFEEVKAFYEAHKADIDAVLAFVKEVVAFLRALGGGTGGGFQAAG